MKKLLLIAAILLMLTLTFMACTRTKATEETTADTPVVTDPATEAPSEEPTELPTEMPTETPTEAPTEVPTETPAVKTFTVTFHVDGNSIPNQPAPQVVEAGGLATRPTVNQPEDGSQLDGWYTSSSFNADTKFDFSTPITEDLTLYAWLSGPMTEPVDPNEPAYYIEPEFIEYNAQNDGANYKKEMGSAEMMTEGDYSFVRLFPDQNGIGDGYVTVIDVGSYTQVANYMAISYRTNGQLNGQMYMGTGERWNGQGDELSLEWIKDNEWHLLIIDLDSTPLTSVRDHVLNYCRLDMFENKTQPEEYLDVEYIAFFDSYEKAQGFYDARHRIPLWYEDKEVIVHSSFDELKKITDGAEVGDIFTPGASADWDSVADLTAGGVDSLKFWGWIGVRGELGQLGYQIDGETPVYDASFAVTAEAPVVEAAAAAGADLAARAAVFVPVAELQGSHTVRILYQSTEGVTVMLAEFTVNLPESSAT